MKITEELCAEVLATGDDAVAGLQGKAAQLTRGEAEAGMAKSAEPLAESGKLYVEAGE